MVEQRERDIPKALKDKAQEKKNYFIVVESVSKLQSIVMAQQEGRKLNLCRDV